MNPIVVMIIIGLAVLIDYFWLDRNKSRWGWMKNWSSFGKGLFFSVFIIISILIYVGLSVVYF
ncbi:hypothetical protein SFC57_04760 [Niallia circulans]|uniref:hypothetical protein n=1 Tax=Niallia circulans TaxID=1397 RepID=UPI003981C3A7